MNNNMDEQFKATFEEALKVDANCIEQEKLDAAQAELDAVAEELQQKLDALDAGDPAKGLPVAVRLRRHGGRGLRVMLMVDETCVRTMGGQWIAALVELGETQRICQKLASLNAQDFGREYQERKAAAEERKHNMDPIAAFMKRRHEARLAAGLEVARTGHFGGADRKLSEAEQAKAAEARTAAVNELRALLATSEDAALASAEVEARPLESSTRPLWQVFVGGWPVSVLSNEFVLDKTEQGTCV